MRQLLFYLFFSLCFIFLSLSPVFAQNTSYYSQTRLSTQYDNAGQSQSRLQISLRNLTSANYPSSLTILIYGDKIKLLSAKDDYGDLNYIHNFQPIGINSIDLKFNRRMVGKNVITHLTLVYQNPPAQRSENTWQVFFPKIDTSSPGDFTYQLSIPSSFGRLIATEIMPQINVKSDQESIYSIKGTSLNFPARLIFGDSYPFTFNLSYPAADRIVLPKDTSTQKIYITNISPTPVNLQLQDNSWVALFSQKDQPINITGYAVFFQKDSQLDIPKLAGYTSPQIDVFTPHPYQYLPSKSVSVSISQSQIIWPFINNAFTITVQNPNFQALYNISLNLSGEGLHILSPSTPTISTLPPMGKIALPVNFSLDLKTLFYSHQLNILISGTQFSYNLSRSSLIIYYIVCCALISFIFLITVYSAIRLWHLYLQRRPG